MPPNQPGGTYEAGIFERTANPRLRGRVARLDSSPHFFYFAQTAWPHVSISGRYRVFTAGLYFTKAITLALPHFWLGTRWHYRLSPRGSPFVDKPYSQRRAMCLPRARTGPAQCSLSGGRSPTSSTRSPSALLMQTCAPACGGSREPVKLGIPMTASSPLYLHLGTRSRCWGHLLANHFNYNYIIRSAWIFISAGVLARGALLFTSPILVLRYYLSRA